MFSLLKKIILGLVVFSANVLASSGYAELKEEESLTKKLSLMRSTELGDSYDPISGSVSFAVTDVSIPGNSNLNVELRRRYGFDDTAGLDEAGYWSLDVPYIQGYFLKLQSSGSSSFISGDGWHNGHVCTGDVAQTVAVSGDQVFNYIEPESYWQGKFLNIPGQTAEVFLSGTGTFSGKQVTKSNYFISSCFSRPDGLGEGIEVTAPDGTKYIFDYSVDQLSLNSPSPAQRHRKILLATKVVDRFGNQVNYNYSGKQLKSIVGSDGRRIDINYTSNFISSVTAGNKTWQYRYSQPYNLSEVELPDGTKWKYSPEFYKQRSAVTQIAGALSQPANLCQKSGNNTMVFTVETPNKVLLSYTVQDVYHGIHNKYFFSRKIVHAKPSCTIRQNLIQKYITGPAIKPQTWIYQYSENNYYTSLSFSYAKPTVIMNSVAYKSTLVKGPDSHLIYYINRDAQSELENKIVAIDSVDPVSLALASRSEYHYGKGIQIGETWKLKYPIRESDRTELRMSMNSNLAEFQVNRYKAVESIYQTDGVDTYFNEYSEVDSFGNPWLLKEYNSFSNNIRFVKTSYLHDVSNWVLSLPQSNSISADGTNWTETSSILYFPWDLSSGISLQPKEYREFGKLTKRISEYHRDGNIKRIEFNAANRWVEFLDYYRGKYRSLKQPGRYNSSDYVSSYREVNYDGTTKSVTDPKGYKTLFNYDNAYRLSNVDLVDPQWSDTNINYSYVTSSEISSNPSYNLNLHQLKQVVTKESYEKTTYFDAFLQPILVRERDISNVSSIRFVNYKYDSNGKLVFQSKSSALANEAVGVKFIYDPLGRLVKTMDIASGLFSTAEYLSGNKSNVRDYKGNLTTTIYKVYGKSDTSLTEKIEQSLSSTEFEYNIFGNPIKISQGGIANHYVYDEDQRLCKLIRPEVNSSYFSYNLLGETVWEATGILDNSLVCNRNIVPENQRVIREYDNQGAVWKTTYPDQTPDQAFSLDVNGNLTNVVFGDSTWTYTYNSLNLLESEQLSVSGNSFGMIYGYSKLGFLNKVKYPSGKQINLTKNAFDQIEQIENYIKEAAYYPTGHLRSMKYGNGVTYYKTLNARSLPDSISASRSDGSKVSDIYYGYDANLNLTSVFDRLNSNNDISMDYDSLDRLKTANGYWGAGSLSYDALGNIKSKVLGGESLNYNYDTNNRLVSVGGYKDYLFEYDVRGNVKRNGYNAFTYNLANQMTNADGSLYKYDQNGRRIVKVKNGKSSYYLYGHSGKLMYIRNERGDHVDHIYLDDELVTTVESR